MENDECIAFLDIFPANRGHTLVIPKKHVADIHRSDSATYAAMSGEAGWQTVFHLHMHVIPRWPNDGLHKPWDIEPASDESLNEVLQLIQK